MKIRKARLEDAPAMGRVMVETYLAAHKGQYAEEAWRKRAEEWTPEVSAVAWARDLREIEANPEIGECHYVAEDEAGEIVGIAMGCPSEEEDAEDVGEVCALYVRQDCQGRGLGRRLMQAVATDLMAKGRQSLWIACLAANAPARRFYEALGGQVARERISEEYGHRIPQVVYGWPDIRTLARMDIPSPKAR